MKAFKYQGSIVYSDGSSCKEIKAIHGEMVPSGMTRLHSKRTSDIGFQPFFPDYDTLVTFLYASPYMDVRVEFSKQKQNVGSRHLKYTCFKKN